MEHLLKEIAERRKQAEQQHEICKGLQATLEQTTQYELLKVAKEMSKAYDEETDRLILGAKAQAMAKYKETMLDPIAGFILKNVTMYAYTREEAEIWAKENARYLFVFDEKGFFSLAKSKNPPPFVTVSKVPEIQLASDLSMYLVELPGETAGNPIKQEPIFSEGPAA